MSNPYPNPIQYSKNNTVKIKHIIPAKLELMQFKHSTFHKFRSSFIIVNRHAENKVNNTKSQSYSAV